jgi:hypothetical protein
LEGRVRGTGFVLRRAMDYPNSFRPVARGRVEPLNGGSMLVGTLGPGPAVTAALVAVGLGALAMGLYFAWWGHALFLLLSAAIILFCYGLSTVGFLLEVGPTRAALEGVAGSQRLPEGSPVTDEELDSAQVSALDRVPEKRKV